MPLASFHVVYTIYNFKNLLGGAGAFQGAFGALLVGARQQFGGALVRRDDEGIFSGGDLGGGGGAREEEGLPLLHVGNR